MKSGDKLAFRLSQIKWGTVDAGHSARHIHPKDHKREGVVKQIPVGEPTRLFFGDGHQIHAAGKHHRNHHTHSQWHFIAHHLRCLTHGAKQRPLRSRCIASQNHSKHLQAQHRNDKENAHVEPLTNKIEREWQSDESAE